MDGLRGKTGGVGSPAAGGTQAAGGIRPADLAAPSLGIGAGAMPGREAGLGLARSLMSTYGPDRALWHYEHGLFLSAARAAGLAWGDPDLAATALSRLASLVGPGGSIAGYRRDEWNLDQVNPGRGLFELLDSDPDGRYRRALDLLASQLKSQPRTPSGGLWHKLIYPDQMWLDGLYMAGPFRARYAASYAGPGDFDDIQRQFELAEAGTLDPRTGLLRHAWDESRTQLWADPETGRSPQVWGRALGWFTMALVDSWEWFPSDHAGKPVLASMLGRLAPAIAACRDPASGLFWQVLDQGSRPGNWLESSASAMFSYALAKGARLGILPADPWRGLAASILEALTARALRSDEAGRLHFEGTCAVAGLGGKPYRDGSFEYYVGEPRKTDDFKGAGPFILASIEYQGRR